MDLRYERQYETPLTNSPLLPLLLLSLARQKYTPIPSKTFKDEYDYIVVGAGGAGCVVASRLSEKPCVDVLLLEAGDVPPRITEVPGLARYLKQKDLTWQFMTVPQKHAQSGFINRQTTFEAGKALGGSGSINGLAYVRGNHHDYDNWAAMGAKGWSYQDVFPYFLKLENERNLLYLANGYHAVGGPISAEKPKYVPLLKEVAFQAAMALGYEVLDSNAATQSGFYALQGFTKDSQRCSSLKGYLVPVDHRKNLDILTNAMVTKVIVEGDRAIGVEMFFKGASHVVKARKEVIVSGGTVNTPKILMLSGIGPREELSKLNIPVVADLPVGKNFHDHGCLEYVFTLNKRFRSFDEKIANPLNILEYINTRRGPLASTDSLNIAFLRSANESRVADDPQFELYINELTGKTLPNLGLKPEVYEQMYGPYEGETLYSCRVQQLTPKSRGTITLNSSDPFDKPAIDPNFLEVPDDITPIIQGLKTCKDLLNTGPLLALDAKPLETLVPGCEKYFGNDEDYFRCFGKTLLYTCLHEVGSCKMGDPADLTTVLDPELRVKGVKGLRVVDASVMPVVPRANLLIPTIMIAEKASDMIKNSISC